MEAIAVLILTGITFAVTAPIVSSNPCRPALCDVNIGPEVRFPFRLRGRQPNRCGYPGFDLYCNRENQTMLLLPESGEFIVDHIDYTAQAVFINDPDFCLPHRILNFSLAGSNFRGAYPRNYTFLNCSSDYLDYTGSHYTPLFCLSGRNHTVLSMDSRSSGMQIPETCRPIGSVVVPLEWTLSQFYWSAMDFREDLELVWREPACSSCETLGGVCGYKGDPDSNPYPEIGCFMPSNSKSGLPRSAKYGIIIGVGIPGLVCIIGLVCYAFGLIRAFTARRRDSSSISTRGDLPVTIFSDRPTIRATNGLDRPTIESYPTTVLGESRRFPKPSDGTCPICLSDYEPKETLRSIPECNHYFHADCIDEWLKLNGSCPVCRKSPESSVGTPCFSVSTSSSSLTAPPDSR
ncbi:putative RING-H2 finger protein ATL21B [Andrographis paniculata]|uniref:putative RING-H2 finger protein ATL21B n=1 Tax=Andrographis paniculata TaxID=175694 RepID=UPI0021E6EA93|nr:putative RING-H2 finger protein ATL21B [Andrographis paniculata]